MYRISWPNRLTLTRILLIAPFVIALLHLQDQRQLVARPQVHLGDAARWAGLAVFALMAVTDLLDGYLARRLREESALGRFLDPLADKLLILCSVLLLANEGTHVQGALLPATVVVTAVGKDLIVVLGFCVIYFITSQTYIHPLPWGKWCTTLQLGMVIAVLVSPDLPGGLGWWVPRVFWWSATVAGIAAAVQYFQLGRRFVAGHEQPIHPA